MVHVKIAIRDKEMIFGAMEMGMIMGIVFVEKKNYVKIVIWEKEMIIGAMERAMNTIHGPGKMMMEARNLKLAIRMDRVVFVISSKPTSSAKTMIFLQNVIQATLIKIPVGIITMMVNIGSNVMKLVIITGVEIMNQVMNMVIGNMPQVIVIPAGKKIPRM